MERSPIPLLLGVSAAGLVALALSPLAAAVAGGSLIIAGIILRTRGSRVTGFGLAATGGALCFAAVLILVLVDARQDAPVIIGPGTGLSPG